MSSPEEIAGMVVGIVERGTPAITERTRELCLHMSPEEALHNARIEGVARFLTFVLPPETEGWRAISEREWKTGDEALVWCNLSGPCSEPDFRLVVLHFTDATFGWGTLGVVGLSPTHFYDFKLPTPPRAPQEGTK